MKYRTALVAMASHALHLTVPMAAAPTGHRAVFRSASQVTGLLRIARKLSSPTKSAAPVTTERIVKF